MDAGISWNVINIYLKNFLSISREISKTRSNIFSLSRCISSIAEVNEPPLSMTFLFSRIRIPESIKERKWWLTEGCSILRRCEISSAETRGRTLNSLSKPCIILNDVSSISRPLMSPRLSQTHLISSPFFLLEGMSNSFKLISCTINHLGK